MRVIALEEHLVLPEVAAANRDLPPDLRSGFDLLSVRRDELAADLADLEDRRIAFMDTYGIDVQVLSHSGPGAQRLAPDQATELTRHINDTVAGAVARHPDRFAAFATLPTPAPDEAADELARCVGELGFCGAMVHGHTGGRYLDRPEFDPILAAAAELGVPLYLHPGEPPAPVRAAYYSDLGVGERSPLVEQLFATAGWGWHVDAAVHALRLVLTGAFDRHPELQIILGHWGELIPYYLGRIDQVMSGVSSHLAKPVGTYLQEHVYITPAGLETVPPLLLALSTFGADRILYSVDYPYSAGRTAGWDFIESAPLSELDKAKIAHLNAERLLPGLPRGE
ncbi:amidohydrolase family protein [Tsukamurella soli]|uniref:Amidohydrolase family protein n=1 Tax=Tsukamurella soli TaxID=644556 RepID=A0ABP8KF61_9ACTN